MFWSHPVPEGLSMVPKTVVVSWAFTTQPAVSNKLKIQINKARTMSAKLRDVNLKNKLEETTKKKKKLEETGRSGKKLRNWKKQKKTQIMGISWKILKETGRNGKKSTKNRE